MGLLGLVFHARAIIKGGGGAIWGMRALYFSPIHFIKIANYFLPTGEQVDHLGVRRAR